MHLFILKKNAAAMQAMTGEDIQEMSIVAMPGWYRGQDQGQEVRIEIRIWDNIKRCKFASSRT
jgi:hypothetical protein